MPEMYITASYTYNDTLTFAGTFEPAFVLTIVGIFPLPFTAYHFYLPFQYLHCPPTLL